MKKNRLKRGKIYHDGPNLYLFSLALLLSIFSAYSIGALVTKKAEYRRQNSNKKLEINTQDKHEFKSIVSGKSYTNSKQNIIYFYEDNTYYLKIDNIGEYGTYEVSENNVILYNLFSMNSEFNSFTTLNGKEVLIIDGNYLIFINGNSSNNDDKYEIENSNISGGMSTTLLKVQTLIESK